MKVIRIIKTETLCVHDRTLAIYQLSTQNKTFRVVCCCIQSLFKNHYFDNSRWHGLYFYDLS